MKNILVVFNKKAGKHKASSLKKIIFNRLKEVKVNFKFIYVDILPLIKNIEKYDTIIAVGGDGTVLSVLPNIVNSTRRLGIVPAGTANLFAESLIIPKNIDKALDVILSKKTSQVDIGKAGQDYFSLRVGFGYDASIIGNTKRSLKQKIGYLAYFIQGIIGAFKLSRKTYRIKIDGKLLDIDANSIIIANAGNMFKNFVTIAPNGDLKDGKLDVFILSVKDFMGFVKVFFQIVLGLHTQSANVFYEQASSVSIQTTEKALHIDGEEKTMNESLNIQIIPEAIKVLVP